MNGRRDISARPDARPSALGRWSKGGPGPEDKAEADRLGDALNEVSRRAAAQWVVGLSLWAYLFFTSAAVTDYDLLVLPPVKLPFIGIELGLLSFFIYAPILYFVMQLYMARKAALLAEMTRDYLAELRRRGFSPEQATRRRHRLDAFAVTHLAARFDGLGAAPAGFFLRVLTWLTVFTTLFLAPLALYAAFQAYFLAYQSDDITLFHRIMLLAGGALGFFTVLKLRGFSGPVRGWGGVAAVGTLLGVILLSWVAFTFPGEEIYADWQREQKLAFYNLPGNLMILVRARLAPKPPESYFAEQAKAGKLEEAKILNLAGQDFSGRNLREIDLNGANLRNASFGDARMDGANLSGATLGGANLLHVILIRANLSSAMLSGANLSFATLIGADLSGAMLIGADLRRAILIGADLPGVTLSGANSSSVILIGANLTNATLSGADLSGATLIGANLTNATLWGADLRYAKIEHIQFTPTEQPPPDAVKLAEIAQSALSVMPAGFLRDLSKLRFAFWEHPVAAAGIRHETEKLHAELRAASAVSTPQQRGVALGKLACSDQYGTYILRQLVRRDSDYISFRQLADTIADPTCTDAKNLDEYIRSRINEKAAREPPLPTASTAAPPAPH